MDKDLILKAFTFFVFLMISVSIGVISGFVVFPLVEKATDSFTLGVIAAILFTYIINIIVFRNNHHE